VEVPAVPYRDLQKEATAESSEKIRNRVAAARILQEKRFKKSKIHSKARMGSRQIKKCCAVDAASSTLLESAIDKPGLSARAYIRILKIAGTIEDLDGTEAIQSPHIAEAIKYRSLDRGRRMF
jgi:magnesium chelatase family protein